MNTQSEASPSLLTRAEGANGTTHVTTPRIAVVGTGNWGINLVRTFKQLGLLHSCCDVEPTRLEKARAIAPSAKLTSSYDEVLSDRDVDAVVIAAPAALHYQLARKALESGRPVFVEKPLTMSVRDARALIDIAHKKNLVLMVGHLLRFHPAVAKLRQLIDAGELGDIYYVYSQRVNLGTIRRDENALWSFAPHDIAIILYLLGDKIETVTARGASYLQKGVEDVTFVNIRYSDRRMAHIQVSWLDPYKERRFTIVGSKKMATFDDMNPTEKIKIYDKGVQPKSYDSYGEYLALRVGDIHIPQIEAVEPLQIECRHFVECLREGKEPLTNGQDGLDVVRVLEVAQKSLRNDGIPVRWNGGNV